MNERTKNEYTFDINGETYWNLPKVYEKIQWHSSVASITTGLMISGLIFANNVKVAFELGLANGFMTQIFGYAMAASCGPEAKLYSLDILEQSVNLSKQKNIPIQHFGICADSLAANFADFIKDKIDLAFIDGDHTYPAAHNDISKTLPLMSEKGIFVIHDYWSHFPGVIQAVAECFDDSWQKFIIPVRPGEYPSVILQRKVDPCTIS